MQQGGSPTPFDRNLGTKMGAKAVEWFSDELRKCTNSDGITVTTEPSSAVMLGIVRRQYRYTPFVELMEVTDFEYVFYLVFSNEFILIYSSLYVIFKRKFRHRIPTYQWWMKLRPLLKVLAKHESTYEEEGLYITIEEMDLQNDPPLV